MSIIDQPESYSQMLLRIFAATLTTGILCTFWIGAISPDIHTFLESWSTETSIGIIDGVKALYLLIPLLVAVLSRAFLLHDKISDFLKIRKSFDLNHVLKPLAESVGYGTKGDDWEVIQNNRDKAMTRTFYRFAGFRDPKIDVQLVRTAADRWGWFWCAVEPSAILFIAAITFAFLRAWIQVGLSLGAIAVLLVLACIQWPLLKQGARNQIDEILANPHWKGEILSALVALRNELHEDQQPSTSLMSSGYISDDSRTPDQSEDKIFDVFLSHNSNDKPTVRVIAEKLKSLGLAVWLDEWELVPGRPWQEALEEIVLTTKAAVVFVGKDGIGPWQDREMRGCLTEFVERDLPVIPVLLPEAPTKPELPLFLKQFTWVDLRSGITNDGLERLLWGITGKRNDE